MSEPDLIAQLRAALDETERIALDACWDDNDSRHWNTHHRALYDGRWVVEDRLDERVTEVSGSAADDGAVAAHIAHNDPARVLAMVAAHRSILDLHHPAVLWLPNPDAECASCAKDLWPCPTVLALAAAHGIEPGRKEHS